MDEALIDSKAYAARLGANYSAFRQALSYRRALEEGREPPVASRRAFVRRIAARIAPEAGRVGRSPVWSLEKIEAFERENPEAARDTGRDLSLDPVLEAAPPAELRRAAKDPRAGLTDRELRVLLARYGAAPARRDPAPRVPTLEDLGRELNVSRQRVARIQAAAERKVRDALG